MRVRSAPGDKSFAEVRPFPSGHLTDQMKMAAFRKNGLVRLTERYGLPELCEAAGVGYLAPPQPHCRRRRPGRVLPVVFVPAIVEDEERFCAMCGCFGERDGFREAFERERLALGDAQHVISNQAANLGQRAQRIRR